jgi:hypothetical protein
MPRVGDTDRAAGAVVPERLVASHPELRTYGPTT